MTRVLLRVDLNTAGLSLSTVVAAPEAASQEAMRVAPVAKGLPVTASGAAFAMFLPLMFKFCCVVKPYLCVKWSAATCPRCALLPLAR